MKNKLLQKLLIALWVLLLSSMGIYYLFFAPRGSDFTEAENRTLAAFPEVTIESVFSGRFGEEFETYLLDRFPLREKAIALVNRFQSAVSLASHEEYLRIAEDVKDPLDNTDYENSMEALLQGLDATEAPTEPTEAPTEEPSELPEEPTDAPAAVTEPEKPQELPEQPQEQQPTQPSSEAEPQKSGILSYWPLAVAGIWFFGGGAVAVWYFLIRPYRKK